MLPVTGLYSPANWSQFFPKSILPTTFIPLSSAVTSFFLQDSVSIPRQWLDLTNAQCYNQPTVQGALPTVVKGHEKEDILNLLLHLKAVSLEFTSGIYPKLEHISPSDALWLMPDHTIRCITNEDVLLLCTGSTKVLEFIKHRSKLDKMVTTTPPTPTTPTPAPFSIYPATTLEKDTTTIPNINTAEVPYKPIFFQNQFTLSLRKWFNPIHPSESFRIMVFNNHILSIAQKDGIRYDWETGKLDHILHLISKFTHNTVLPTWKSYIKFALGEAGVGEISNAGGDCNSDQNDYNSTLTPTTELTTIQLHHFNPSSINIMFDVYVNLKNNSVRLLDVGPLPECVLMGTVIDINNDQITNYIDFDPEDLSPDSALQEFIGNTVVGIDKIKAIEDGMIPVGNIDVEGVCQNGQNGQNGQQNQRTVLTQAYIQLLQQDPILFSPTTLSTLTKVHTIQPYALSLLRQCGANITTNTNTNATPSTPTPDITFFTQTRINNSPLSVHICQLLLNLIAAKEHFNHNGQNGQSSQFLSHPLYSYTMPPTLPQIPSDQCLGLNFQYHYTPQQIPQQLEKLWSVFVESLPESIIKMVAVDSKIQPGELFFPKKTTTYLFPNPKQTKSDKKSNQKRTGPYLDNIVDDDDDDEAVVVEDEDGATTTNNNNNSSSLDTLSSNLSTSLVDYTYVLPKCSALITELIQDTQGREILGYCLLLLQHIFLTQLTQNLNLTPDFLLNETLQSIAQVKTDIVQAYHGNGLVVNAEGFVKPINGRKPIKAPPQPNSNTNNKDEPKVTDYDATALVSTIFPTQQSTQSGNVNANTQSQQPQSSSSSQPPQTLSPSLPHLPLLVKSIPPQQIQYTNIISSKITNNGGDLPSRFNVLVPLPSYPLITPREPPTTTPTRSRIAQAEVIDPALDFIETNATLPQLATQIISTSLLMTATSQPLTSPTPFHIVTDYTQAQEDERVTVQQQASRLPAEEGLDIDLSSAEGIAAFVSLMTMMQGDGDCDWSSDEDDESD